MVPERNDFLLFADVLEELGGASEGHSLDGLTGLARVLVVDAQVGAARLHRLGGILGLSGITRHCADLALTLLRLGAKRNIHSIGNNQYTSHTKSLVCVEYVGYEKWIAGE